MTMTGSQPQNSAAPPRTLNVQKFAESRAAEIKSLQSVVANRLNNDFRSQRNKRRRTTGYENRGAKSRFRKRQRLGASNDKALEIDEKGEGKAVPRHIRRRIELRKNPQTGFSTSGDGTKRLRTHVWHAKRFKMTKLWGFHLPLHLQGRGRGSRALLKKLKHGVLAHDASYYAAVQLEGPEDLLLSILENHFVPSPSTYSESTYSKIISGVMYGSAVLYHGGSPFSHAVAPVTFMWRPPRYRGFSTEDQKTDASDEQNIVNSCLPSRQLWVWIHPAAFGEGYDTLKNACGRQTDVTGHLVNCISLEDQLGKIELMGLKTSELLQKILHRVTCFPVNSEHLCKCSAAGVDGETQHDSTSILENEDEISTSAVISLIAKDPRILTKEKIHVAQDANLSGILGNREDETTGQMSLSDTDGISVSLSFLNPEENVHLHKYVNLWDADKGVRPPVEESILCHEKHRQRLDFCRITGKSSGQLDTSVKEQFSKFCPALLLKHNNRGGSIIRWSIILPLSWVKAFWVPLVSNGGHAIGLTEKHWVASEVGLSYFPLDFPDSSAYSSFMAIKATTSNQDADLRPSWMRSLRVPYPPPWDSIRLAFDKIIGGVTQLQCEVNCTALIEDSVKHFDSERCEIAALRGHGGAFMGFIARTSSTLSYYLNHINGNQLLLFPTGAGQKICMSKAMNNESMINQDPVHSCKIPCFLRVLLHAYKEGVFEEGAAVCAPYAEDIRLLRLSEEKGVLQLPQSSLKSYFVQQPSGQWVLQVPEDPLLKESYRWPIGFVTTGFIRGSKKPVAFAVCEAKLLACLRWEQWKAVSARQRRKEIYVLVRNLRSTAYRLALATIVLEAHEEDVEST